MSKKTRIKACELATQCIGAEVAAGGSTAGRLMALVVFFENYIEHGADANAIMRSPGSARRGHLAPEHLA